MISLNDIIHVSSRQTADLLGMHESSVKRWCNAGDLPCAYTDGGHRRIDLADVLAFARASGLECSLLPFDEDAALVWTGISQLRIAQASDALRIKVRDWLLNAEADKVIALIRLGRSQHISLAHIFDEVIGRLLCEVGESWARGELEIGEEHRVSECVLDVLYGLWSEVGANPGANGQLAIVASGPGEDHVTGALMVRILLAELGWNVIYLGRGVPEEDLLLFQRKHRARLVCVSVSSRREPNEITRFIRSTMSLRRPDLPFELAVGGSGIGSLLEALERRPSVSHVHLFSSARSFVEWAKTLS